MQLLAWILVACSVLVIALGATATLVILRSSSTDIPVVANIQAEQSAGAVTFEWADPGIDSSDSYRVDLDGGAQSVQTQPTFTVDADDGDHVCITVRVSRDGTLGEASNPKCVDFVG
jgi:hypothetical protein